MIREVIVVEGRDDTAAIKRALDADTIETHGFGITEATWLLIETAYNQRGIIIFTDPDFSGNEIRKKIKARFPEAQDAFLDKKDAERNGNVGIENASPEAIVNALAKAKYTLRTPRREFTQEDLFAGGLAGSAGSAKKRGRMGDLLGIGYGNAATFLEKLNNYGITREDYDEALREINDKRDKG